MGEFKQSFFINVVILFAFILSILAELNLQNTLSVNRNGVAVLTELKGDLLSSESRGQGLFSELFRSLYLTENGNSYLLQDFKKTFIEHANQDIDFVQSIKFDNNISNANNSIATIISSYKTYTENVSNLLEHSVSKPSSNAKEISIVAESFKKLSDAYTGTVGFIETDLDKLSVQDESIREQITILLALTFVVIFCLCIYSLIKLIQLSNCTEERFLSKLKSIFREGKVEQKEEEGPVEEKGPSSEVQVDENTSVGEPVVESAEEQSEAYGYCDKSVLNEVINQFNGNIKKTSESIGSSAFDLEDFSKSLFDSVKEGFERVNNLFTSASEALDEVNSMEGVLKEVAASNDLVKKHIQDSASITHEAVSKIESASGTVEGLAKSTMEISEVTNMINDIAEQTNLLALNATIEAARAGEAGKGFAVVASEVKNLAKQTAGATEKISSQIRGIQEQSKLAVVFIDDISKIIKSMNALSQQVSVNLGEQSQGVSSIASSINKTKISVSSVSGNLEEVKIKAEENNNSAESVSKICTNLAKETMILNEQIEKLLVDLEKV